MSKKTIDLLVTATMTAINTKITTAGAVITPEQVERIFNDAIKHAYDQCTDAEDKTYLYRQLSRKFHPDSLDNSTEDFARVICHDENLKKIPQQVLGRIHTNADFLNNLRNDPMAASQSIVAQFILQFMDELNQYKRYVEPIATMVYITQAVINTILIAAGISVIVGLIITDIAVSIVRFIEETLLNIATNYQYKLELEKCITPEARAKAAANYLKAVNIDISNVVDDAEMLELFFGSLSVMPRADADNLLNSLAKAELSSGTRLMAIINAFGNQITSDLPQGLVNKGVSILNRIILAALIIPFVALEASIQLYTIAFTTILLATIALALFTKVAATLLLNSPLYLLDGLTYLANVVSQMVDKVNAHFTANAEPAPAAAAAEVRPDSDLPGSAAADMEAGYAMNDNSSEANGATPGQDRAATEGLSSLLQNSIFASDPDASNADAFHSVSSRASSPGFSNFADID